jgi:hypothetical protein
LSLNRLVNLERLSLKNQFKVADTIGIISMPIITSLHCLKIDSCEVLAKTNSANYTGTELNVNWSNRNVFKGLNCLPYQHLEDWKYRFQV